MLDRKKMTLPEWTKNLPDKTRITSKEVSSFFGYKSKYGIQTLLQRGQFPKHEDTQPNAKFSNRVFKSNYWYLGSLRSYVIEQNKENK
jgi:hypothetical protein